MLPHRRAEAFAIDILVLESTREAVLITGFVAIRQGCRIFLCHAASGTNEAVGVIVLVGLADEP